MRSCTLTPPCPGCCAADIFYEQADALVGVSKDLQRGSSTTFTLDLNRFG